MKCRAGGNWPNDGHAFKALADRGKRHDRAGMTGFDRGIRSRTIGIGLCCADRKIVGLDRPEISTDMQDACHGNDNRTGHPDQGPEGAEPRTQFRKHIAWHTILDTAAGLPSMT